VAHDPEHIPDGNVQATVGRHLLFHEQIPKAANGSGYLRVATKSLWWGGTNTFPKYGRRKDSQRAWKMATNGPSTARRGTNSE
jgi:hypothetical protein